MAQTVPCDMHDTPVAADFMISNIANGDTLGVCADHMTAFGDSLRAAREAMTEGEPDAFTLEHNTETDEWTTLGTDGERRPATADEIAEALTFQANANAAIAASAAS